MLDPAELRRILSAPHTYYDKDRVNYDHLGAVPQTRELLDRLLDGADSVLDIGCGRGDTLLRNTSRIRRAVGIDDDPSRLALAQQNFARLRATNLTALRCRARNLCFADNTFDRIFSERGPLGHNDYNLAEAVRVLRPGGQLFIETIAEWNHHEMKKHFERSYTKPPSSLGCLQAEEQRFAHFGMQIETLASRLQTLRFADFYEWLKYQCTVWTYLGQPLPSPHDLAPFERFAADTTDDKGRIHLTYHTIWIAGRKPHSR
jgi:ubiquinone/menaquinone biosynthesis C-methylase UbiE